jgi:hypothetical protein
LVIQVRQDVPFLLAGSNVHVSRAQMGAADPPCMFPLFAGANQAYEAIAEISNASLRTELDSRGEQKNSG